MGLDLRNVADPAEAAKLLHDYLRYEHRAGSGLSLLSPEDAGRLVGGGEFWRVMWEGGPHEWGVAVSLGGRVDESSHGFRYDRGPEILGLKNRSWYLEPNYSFDVGFIPLPARK